jgi:hypothetical protein
MASMIGREGEPIVHDARRVFKRKSLCCGPPDRLAAPISPMLLVMIRFDLDIMMAKCGRAESDIYPISI